MTSSWNGPWQRDRTAAAAGASAGSPPRGFPGVAAGTRFIAWNGGGPSLRLAGATARMSLDDVVVHVAVQRHDAEDLERAVLQLDREESIRTAGCRCLARLSVLPGCGRNVEMDLHLSAMPLFAERKLTRRRLNEFRELHAPWYCRFLLFAPGGLACRESESEPSMSRLQLGQFISSGI